MRCSSCGKTIDSADPFCAYCGAAVERTGRLHRGLVLPAIGLAFLATAALGACLMVLVLPILLPDLTARVSPQASQLAGVPVQPAAGPAPAGPRPPEAEPVVVPFVCPDELGCVTIGPDDPVHIAYLFVTSGDNAALGLDTKYGAELAVGDAGGQVLGHSIKFDGEDTRCSAEGGEAAAKQVAADETVVAVIGPSCSDEARTAARIVLAEAGIAAMISPSNTASDLTDPGEHVTGYFRTVHNDRVQGAVAANFARKRLGFTKAATIHNGSRYAQGLAVVFADTFRKNGGIITAQEEINPGDDDMRPALRRIATGKPDLIYYPLFVGEGGLICEQTRHVPGLEETTMMGSDAIFSPDFFRACGKNVVGMFFSAPNLSGFGYAHELFVQKYFATYNVTRTLGPFHAHSYDAMKLVLQALQKPGVVVKDADGTLHLLKRALREAIAQTDMQGITGHIKCDPNGDCADPKIAVYMVTGNNFRNLEMPKDPVWLPDWLDYEVR